MQREPLPILKTRDSGNGTIQVHRGHYWSDPIKVKNNKNN